MRFDRQQKRGKRVDNVFGPLSRQIAAAKCSGRVSTASYSMSMGTVATAVSWRRSIICMIERDAPVLLLTPCNQDIGIHHNSHIIYDMMFWDRKSISIVCSLIVSILSVKTSSPLCINSIACGIR
jgi:hypothetical protein